MRRTALCSLLPGLAALALCAACGFGPFGSGTDATPTPTASPVPTATPSPTPEPTPPRPAVVARARITTDDLNVRVGPGREFPAIGRLHPGDEVAILGRSADDQWLALDGLGWSFYDAGWYELDAPVSTLPTVGAEASAAPTHPRGLDSGFPALNGVIGEVEDASADLLASLVEPTAAPCVRGGDGGGSSEDAAAAGPACATGVAEGTPTDAIAVAGCDAGWAPPADARRVIERFLSDVRGRRAPLGVYAIIGDTTVDSAATYVVIFAFATGEARTLWLDENGAITRIGIGCEARSAGYQLTAIADEPVYYVAPFAPAPLEPLR